MQTLLSVVHVAVSLFMILVILLQAGKSGGMGALGSGSVQVFGGRGSQTILSKVTSICAIIFMVTSLSLAWLSSRSSSMVEQRAARVREEAAKTSPAAEPTKPAVEAAPTDAAPAEVPAAAPADGTAP